MPRLSAAFRFIMCSPCAGLILAALLLIPGGADAAKKTTAPAAKPWLEMNRGPCMSASIESSLPEREMTPKGLIIRVSPAGAAEAVSAYVLFDEDLLRYSVGWTGGSIDFKGVVFDGTHRVWPTVVGPQIFGTAMLPGWAMNGSFDDPRKKYPSTNYAPEPPTWQNRGYGPLPHEQARFKGLYLNRDRVILSYTVTQTPVLDSPGSERAGSIGMFTRTLNIEHSSKDMILQVLEHPGKGGGIVALDAAAAEKKPTANGSAMATLALLGSDVAPAGEAGDKKPHSLAVAAVGASREMKWEVTDQQQLRLHIPAASTPANVKILIAPVPVADRPAFAEAAKNSPAAEDLSQLTHGGPPRWPEGVTSDIKPGADDQPYTVDTLTAPTANPWHAPTRFGGFDFFKDGHRAAICTWDGDVFIVDGLGVGATPASPASDGKAKPPVPAKLTWQRIATGMFQPLGVKIVPDDRGREQIYVCCRDQITRLHDLNGDGEIDFYETFNNDHQVTEHFHEFAMGLQTDAEGNFYYAKSARHALDAVVPQHGTLIKVSKDGSKSEILCNGFRAANGFGLGPNGEMAATDQEGYWTPANRINLVKPGGFYGNLWSYLSTPRSASEGYDPPLCWLPVKLDRSPAEDLWVTSDQWGPLKGKMIHTSYGVGKLFLIPYEFVDGVPQGGAVPFPGINFPTGVMRARFNPADGQLYACGLVGWSSNCAEPGGFYRVRYTGKKVCMPAGLEIKKDGVLLTFTEPLDKEAAQDPDNYAVRQWQYRWTENYGSPQYSVANPNKQALDDVEVTAAKLSADGKSVLLQIPKIKPVMQMQIELNIKAADGAAVKMIVHNTINKVPK